MSWLAASGEVLAVGVAYAAAMSLPRLLRSSAAQSGAAASMLPSWWMSLLTGCLFALAVRPLVASLSLSTAGLIVALWLLLFVLGFLLSMLEAVAFSDGPSPIRMHHILGAMVAAAFAAVTAGFVMSPPSSSSLAVNLEGLVGRFGWPTLGLRVAGTAVAFMVAYCTIGSMAWPLVRPYYTDAKLGLRLRIPSGPIVILLQLGRGLLAILALLPLIASSSARGLDWWGRFAIAIAVTSGVIPLLNAPGWPTYLRVVHGVEIVVFAVVYSFLLLWILVG